MKKICILTTGGTIDKIYFDANSTYEIGAPYIENALKTLPPLNIQYRIVSVLKKDSLEMNEADRTKVYQAVHEACEEHVVITHGTDTMKDTANTLSTIANKTIVLTGAMQPGLFRDSDALFNIGCAIATAQTMPHGVYITMSGQVFDYQEVIKDRQNQRFTELDTYSSSE